MQGAWRAKVARRRIRVMVRNQYRKKWDDKKQKFYYYNKRTKTSHWTKPLCLGSEDLVLSARTREISGYVSPRRTPRVHAEDLDDETAAKMLQGAWRAKIARRKLKAMVRRQYKKCVGAKQQNKIICVPHKRKFFGVPSHIGQLPLQK